MKDQVTPKQVALALGVSEASIKRWCDLGLIPTVRTAGGHRRLPISGVLEFLRERGYPLIRPEVIGLPSVTGVGPMVLQRAHELLVEAMKLGDEEAFRRVVLDCYGGGISAADIFDQVMARAFHSIGEFWQHGDVEIYQERRGIELAMRSIYQLQLLISRPGSEAPRAFGCTPEGDPYALPTLMIETVMKDLGWRAESLGPGHPFSTLEVAIRRKRPALVWMSISSLSDADHFILNFRSFYNNIQNIGAVLVVGGRALTPELRQQMRYHAYCDNLRHLTDFVTTLRPHRELTAASPLAIDLDPRDDDPLLPTN